MYAVPLTPLGSTKGESPVYRHPASVNGLTTRIPRFPDIDTLQKLHQNNAKLFHDVDCLGTRVKQDDSSAGPYKFKTYTDVFKLAQVAGSAIHKLKLAPLVKEQGWPDVNPLVIYAKNCEQWVVLDIACCLYSCAAVPIFNGLGLDSLQHIFNQTGSTTIFVDQEHINGLMQKIKSKTLQISTVVSLGDYSLAHKQDASATGVQLLSWDEFLDHGTEIVSFPTVTPSTVFSLCYTSGTTGNPKAAILTHSNIIAVIAGCDDHPGLGLTMINKGDVHLSYLPLAHIFERVFVHQSLSRGVTVGFFQGNPLKIGDDLQTLKPTFMIGVPRLFNKLYEGVDVIVNKITKGGIQNLSNEEKLEALQKLDPKIIDQLKMATGGRVKGYITGSAPISPFIQKYLRIAWGAPFMEGYGQTETGSTTFNATPADLGEGSIGGPTTSVEFKLVDVPKMNYTTHDKGPDGKPMPRGELCLRGGLVFQGYYKEKEKTGETIDQDGWHHTGDIALLKPNGSLRLIDRKKNIIKLAQGEFISPEKIANIYLSNKYVAEIYVYGDSFQSNTVAVIVPDRENLLALAEERHLENKTFEELCEDPKIVGEIFLEINRTGRASKLMGFELVQNVYLEPVSFVIHGLTTPSMKLKRDIAKEHFQDVLNKLYLKPKL